MGADEEVCAVVLVGADGVEVVLGYLTGRRADLALVDALARLQLAARRRGCSIRLRDPGEPVCRLLDLVGLADLVSRPPGSTREARGEPEGGE
jgi:hypothetical protein